MKPLFYIFNALALLLLTSCLHIQDEEVVSLEARIERNASPQDIVGMWHRSASAPPTLGVEESLLFKSNGICIYSARDKGNPFFLDGGNHSQGAGEWKYIGNGQWSASFGSFYVHKGAIVGETTFRMAGDKIISSSHIGKGVFSRVN